MYYPDMIKMQQVHGNRVVQVDIKDDGKTIKNCDALISNDPKVTLCVRVADCLPIFVTGEKGQVIGLIHAGWRGLSQGIIKSTISKMENQWKVETGKLKIVIGPYICRKHYEVKEDVASNFLHSGGLSYEGSRTFLDLAEVAREQFMGLGIKKENIKVDKRCTFEDKDLFSFRGNGTSQRNIYTLSFPI